jgi:hypothetical protein
MDAGSTVWRQACLIIGDPRDQLQLVKRVPPDDAPLTRTKTPDSIVVVGQAPNCPPSRETRAHDQRNAHPSGASKACCDRHPPHRRPARRPTPNEATRDLARFSRGTNNPRHQFGVRQLTVADYALVT